MDDFERAKQLDREIHRLHMKCSFCMLRNEDVHPGQMPILRAIYEAGAQGAKRPGCSQMRIAQMLGVSAASVGVSIKRLEKAGYVARRVDATDGRINTVTLTPKGAAVWRKACDAQNRLIQQKLRGFTPQEMEQYIAYLQRILQNMQQYRETLEELEEG